MTLMGVHGYTMGLTLWLTQVTVIFLTEYSANGSMNVSVTVRP